MKKGCQDEITNGKTESSQKEGLERTSKFIKIWKWHIRTFTVKKKMKKRKKITMGQKTGT